MSFVLLMISLVFLTDALLSAKAARLVCGASVALRRCERTDWFRERGLACRERERAETEKGGARFRHAGAGETCAGKTDGYGRAAGGLPLHLY